MSESNSAENRQSQSFERQESEVSVKPVLSTYGIFFCQQCEDMLIPDRAKQNFLVFSCRRCGPQQVDFKDRYNKDCMIYSKQLQLGSRKSIADNDFALDPTMPRIKITCSECGYNQAVYFLTPDEGQRKIVVKLICANTDGKSKIKCYNIWEMSQNDNLYHQFQNKIPSKIQSIE